MTLYDEAERAEKIRNAFTGFTAPCPTNVQEINRTISELSGLACALRDVQGAVEAQPGPLHNDIRENLENVHSDVTFTLRDVWRSLGRMGGGRKVFTVQDFQRTWREISTQLVVGKTLHKRLERYRRLLELIARILNRQFDRLSDFDDMDDHEVRALQRKGQRLLQTHHLLDPIETGMGSLAIDKAAIKKPSYERQRPLSPTESTTSSKTDNFKFPGPLAPTPPLSPTQTFSSLNSHVSSLASAGGGGGGGGDADGTSSSTHWAKYVFKNLSSTPLPWNELEPTRYHEQCALPEWGLPNSAYESALTIRYPEGLNIILYCRPKDYRAKVVAYFKDYRSRPDHSCQPLEALHLRREGSLLRLCGRKRNGISVPWVTLKFTTIERLVLFACVFLAMRSQDAVRPHFTVKDDELKDETLEFGGVILDSNFRHGLRVYHDSVSNAVRLQASVHGGELDRSPVWTAFITHSLMSPAWCRPLKKRIVCLAEIRQHVFSARYQPPEGQFLLNFETEADATAFVGIIQHLRTQRIS